MRILTLICLLAISFSSLQAQRAPQYTKKSDPASVKLLKKVHKKYKAYKTMKMDLKMTLKSGKKTETQTAKLTVKGSKFKMTSKSADVICDGSTLWNHQKYNKELYISDPEEEDLGMFNTPDKLLKTFQKDYISAIVATTKEKGRAVYKVEFKPKSRDAEYTKIRVTIDKATSQMKRIKIFDRSNTHYTIDITNVKSNVTVKDNIFKVNVKNLPKGTEVIDLKE